MEIRTTYQGAPVVLTIEHTESSKTALLSASLTPRERQLLLLLDKGDELSSLAVSQLIAKLNIEKLANQGFLSLNFQSLKGNSDPLTANSPAYDGMIANTTDKKTVVATTTKSLVKNSKLQSFLSAYKEVEAENCSLEKCQTCDKADECATDTAALLQEVQQLKGNEKSYVMDDINPEFETIMVAQALIHVA